MAQRKKVKRWFSIIAAACAVIVFWSFAVSLLKTHVRQVVTLNKEAKLRFDSIYPSAHHGIYIEFQVIGDSEISRAFVRAYPWLQVDIEK